MIHFLVFIKMGTADRKQLKYLQFITNFNNLSFDFSQVFRVQIRTQN